MLDWAEKLLQSCLLATAFTLGYCRSHPCGLHICNNLPLHDVINIASDWVIKPHGCSQIAGTSLGPVGAYD